MEIDIRQIPAGERLSKVLSAAQELAFDEVLTLITAEDPEPIAADVRAALGDDVDIQRLRWGGKAITWRLYVKKSRMPSAYQPEE